MEGINLQMLTEKIDALIEYSDLVKKTAENDLELKWAFGYREGIKHTLEIIKSCIVDKPKTQEAR